jgi:hypothetical protein
MHKEKGQALVEFLTPEDASVALSFDGSSFSGSILKIRRPKDFVEVAVRMTILAISFSSSLLSCLVFCVACFILYVEYMKFIFF